MSSVVISGDVSGSVTLQAPSAAGSTTITLPSTSGTMLTTTSGQWITSGSDIYYNTGNVGIGTSSPGNYGKFQVSNGTNQLAVGFLTNKPIISAVNSAGSAYADLLFDGTTQQFYTGGGERMRISSTGQLLVGASSADAATTSSFQYAGTTYSTSMNQSTSARGLEIVGTANNTSNAASLQLTQFNSSGRISQGYTTTQGGFMAFGQTNGSANIVEQMRIDSSGNVLVGKTTTSTTTAGVQLIPNGTAAFTFDTTGDGPLTQFVDPNASTPNGFRFLSFRWGASPTEIGTITKSGASSTAYNTSSDYRLKENVQLMTGALEKVALLKPVTYTWKADGSDGQGFIAHELQEVVPDCVTGLKDEIQIEQYEISPAIPATYDDEGNELTSAVEAVMGEREVPKYQGIDTSFLVATLTAALQELSAKVKELEAKVNA